MKNYTLNEINDILIDYIEKNKKVHDISYEDSIKVITELIEELKKDYDEIIGGNYEN